MAQRDWAGWHTAYDDPTSKLARRLAVVQARIRDALDAAPPGAIRAVSLCAGQGRDLLDVLAGHPRRADVTARLVELDPRNVAAARSSAAAAGLAGVEVIEGDAALTDNYTGAVPAGLVLVCGVFGNVSDADIEATVGFLPQFVASGGIVVWTRHRGEPDLVPSIERWFVARGFDRVWLSAKEAGFGVGVHRFTRAPEPLRPGARMFTFTR
jgi:hypothetical protein